MIKKLIQTYRDLSIVAKSALWFTICTFIQKGIAMITTPIFTRVMPTSEYGLLTVYNSWVLLIDIIATMEFPQGVFNKGMIKYKEDKDGFTSSLLILTTVLTCIVFGTLFILRNALRNIIQLSDTLYLMMFLQILFQAPLTYWTVRKKFDYRYKSVVAVSLSSSIAATVLSLILVINARNNQTIYKVLGTLIVSILVNTFLYLFIIKRGRLAYKKEYWQYALLFNIPLIPHFLSQQVLSQSDRIMISNICGSTDAAFYSVAYTLGSVLLLVLNAIQSSFIPWMYRKVEKSEFKDIKSRSNQIFIVGGIVCLLFPLLAPEFIYFLGGTKYEVASYVVSPISMSVLFTLMYSLFCNIEMYYEKNKYVMLASCIAAGLNLALNAIFIPIYGFVAAGYTTVFCYAILALIHNLMLIKVCKQNDIELMFDYKMMWAIGLVFTTISVLTSFLYPFRYVRFGIIGILSISIVALQKTKKIDVISILKEK